MGQGVRDHIELAERELLLKFFIGSGAGVVQMLPYNSGTFCGYQLHSVVINYPVRSFQTKASHAFKALFFLAIGSRAQKTKW